jgi:predicted nucleic acid-binding protein
MTFVDTNVILDLVTNDPVWGAWSWEQLRLASRSGRLLINDVVYAELAARYDDIANLDEMIEGTGLERAQIPRAALFSAGKAFHRYRQSGGTRTGVLPDFFIGAHAADLQVPLLTRDSARFRTYFPTLELITPQ